MVNGLRELFEKAAAEDGARGRLLSYEQFMNYNVISHPMPPSEEP